MILKNGKRLDGMGDSMPIGSIIEYNGTSVPEGWEIVEEGPVHVQNGGSGEMETDMFFLPANQSIATSTFTTIKYADSIGSCFSVSDGIITCNKTGKYLALLNTIFNTDTSGGRYQDIRYNDMSYALATLTGVSGLRSCLSSSAILDLSKGDTLFARAYQTTESSLDLISGTSGGSISFINLGSLVTEGGSGNAIPTDFNTKWVNAELTEHFKLYNDASYCRYAKIGNMVNIQFVLSPASANNILNSATETTAFKIPEEYRPSQNLNVLCQGSGTNIFNVGINVSGNVNIYRYRNSSSYSSTPPSTTAWLPCNITYFVDEGELLVGNTGGSDLTLEKIYPVNSIYISASNINPKDLFGFGTWEQIKDRFLLAAGDTYAGGSSGGEAEVTLTVDKIPAHEHDTWRLPLVDTYGGGDTVSGYVLPALSAKTAPKNLTSKTGGGQPHNNMPPYLAVYIWKRVA